MTEALLGFFILLWLATLVVAPMVGYRIGRGRQAAALTKHTHAWEPWELTGETIKSYTERRGSYLNPIQQRKCLGCGRVEREEIRT
jgi:hypothetical protein